MPKSAVRSLPSAAVIFHPLKTNLARLRIAIGDAQRSLGWPAVRWYETDADDAGVAATRRALADGASLVMAVGGDGTVRAVAHGLRGTGVPLAIIPQGTGNVLARNLGMPLSDLGAQVQAAFRGVNRTIDTGVARIVRPDETEEEHAFLVLAGMGLDARTISTTRSTLKRRLGWLAYVDAGVRTMIMDDPLQLRYSVDASPIRSLSVYTVMIGNCGLLPGGVLLIPDAKLDDGKLDVIALRPLGPFSWLRIWNKIGWENGVLRRSRTGRKIIDLSNDTRSVTTLQAKHFAVSVDSPELVQLDGDDFGEALAVSGEVQSGSLVVRVLPEWRPVG